MKIKILPALSFLFLSSLLSTLSFGQDVIRFRTERASGEDDLLYREHFKEYTVASLATENTANLLRSKPYFDNLFLEVQGKSFSFNLEARDIRPAHYKLRYQDETGIHEVPRSPNKTYSGRTNSGNYDVRITADDHFFNAIIAQATDVFYIEPARNINPAASRDHFVLYWGKDNLKKMTNDVCGVTDTHTHAHHPDEINPPSQGENDRVVVCKEVQIALADDFEMFQQEGSVAEVERIAPDDADRRADAAAAHEVAALGIGAVEKHRAGANRPQRTATAVTHVAAIAAAVAAAIAGRNRAVSGGRHRGC